MKLVASAVLFLTPILWASYYAVTKEALQRFEPVVFATLDVLVALPFGVAIVIFWRKHIDRATMIGGMVLGALLACELLVYSFALNYTTATNAGFIPSTQGFLAIIIAAFALRQRIAAPTWIAGLVCLMGALLVVLESPNSGGHWGGDALIFLGTFIFTAYVFAVDRIASGNKIPLWPCFGVQLVTVAVIIGAVSPFFVDWSEFSQPATADVYIILYVGIATTVAPAAICIFFQPYVSPVYVAFIFVLEPLWSALVSTLYLGETVTTLAYVGGGMILIAALANTIHDNLSAQPAGAARRAAKVPSPCIRRDPR